MQHYGLFPVDVNRAPFEMLLRVPGIGPKSARRIWRARKQAALGLDELKRMGVVLKRAQYFITCRGFSGAHPGRGSAGRERITRALIDPNVFSGSCEQLSLFSPPAVDNLIGQGVPPPDGCPHGKGGGSAMSCQGTVSPKGARKLHDADVVYLYDGSFEGFSVLRVRKLCPARTPLCGVDAPAGNGHPLPGQGHCHRPRRCPAGIRQLWQKAGRRDRVPRQPGFFSPGRRTRSCCCSAFCIWPLRWVRARSSGRGIRWSRPSTP